MACSNWPRSAICARKGRYDPHGQAIILSSGPAPPRRVLRVTAGVGRTVIALLCHICVDWPKFIGAAATWPWASRMPSPVKARDLSIVALFFCSRIVVVGEIQGYQAIPRNGGSRWIEYGRKPCACVITSCTIEFPASIERRVSLDTDRRTRISPRIGGNAPDLRRLRSEAGIGALTHVIPRGDFFRGINLSTPLVAM